MSYTIGQAIHVLSIINDTVIYWYTGHLLWPVFTNNNISSTVWYIKALDEAPDGPVFKLDTTKTITVPADTYELPAGTFTAEQVCKFAQIAYSSEITALNMFPIMNINFNTYRITMKIEGGKDIVLPVTNGQLAASQTHVDMASVLHNLHNTVKRVASEEEAAAARILLNIKGVSVAATPSSGKELPSLFIQFDYK
jgi:hypothetical protein